MPNIPLTELIDGVSISFTMAQVRAPWVATHPCLANAVVDASSNAKGEWNLEPPMALPSTLCIRLNAAAGLLAIGAVALAVQSSVASPSWPPQRA
jgi:hypothetical protein